MKFLLQITTLLFVTFCYASTLRADTLFVRKTHNFKEKILIYDGKYYTQFKLFKLKPDTNYYDLMVVSGTYVISNNKIKFIDPAPMDDTIKNKYFIWLPRRAGPQHLFNIDKIVKEIFGLELKLIGSRGGQFLTTTGKFEDGVLILDRKKYTIETK